jgi:SanA protein
MPRSSSDNSLDNDMTRRRFAFLAGFFLLLGLCVFPLFWRFVIKEWSSRHVFSLHTVPEKPVAIVYGAAVYGSGRLSSVLRDRMDTAVHLYQSGKVQRIVVSGDNRTPDYNEPGAMLAYAVSLGVPADHVQPDYAGRRTYDTCYRAGHIFDVESAILVTQAFHLPRALFTCKSLGIDVVGVAADQRTYRAARWYEFRETAATLQALLDVLRRQPPPVLGDRMPIE